LSPRPDESWKSTIVRKILDGKTEEAILLLSEQYGVTPPKIKVGRVKGYSKALGCYKARTQTIHISSGDYFTEPFIVLHEFYHHLRTTAGVHRGVEKGADRFANDFIRSYFRIVGRQRF